MSKKLPTWPDSLPLPTRLEYSPAPLYLIEQDFAKPSAYDDLVHDIYWFPERQYFLYFKHGEGIRKSLRETLESCGIEMRMVELHYYPRPLPAYPNDFIQILPHDVTHDWQKEALQEQMYGRVLLTLENAVRKRLDFKEAARVTTAEIADSEPLIDLKPNFFGIGANFNSIYHRYQQPLRRVLSVPVRWGWRNRIVMLVGVCVVVVLALAIL